VEASEVRGSAFFQLFTAIDDKGNKIYLIVSKKNQTVIKVLSAYSFCNFSLSNECYTHQLIKSIILKRELACCSSS